jgi:hypothetical protein
MRASDRSVVADEGRNDIMSTTDIALNLGILALMVLTQFGRHTWEARKLLLPAGIVAGVGYFFLPGAPTTGHDVALDVVGVTAGIVCGLIAAAYVRVERAEGGHIVTRAGLGYLAIWTAVVGGRLLFAWGADHAWSGQIRDFSIAHQITGADAWRTAFVLMALAMVLTRTATTAARALLAARRPTLVPAQHAA